MIDERDRTMKTDILRISQQLIAVEGKTTFWIVKAQLSTIAQSLMLINVFLKKLYLSLHLMMKLFPSQSIKNSILHLFCKKLTRLPNKFDNLLTTGARS